MSYDVITLGETMLRLTPPDLRRLEQAITFTIEIGGSESNTAVGLARLGRSVAWLSRLPAHALGWHIARTLASHGVDTTHVLWAEDEPPRDWTSNEPGAYVDLHQVAGRKERVDQNHVKYFLDLKPGEKRFVTYSVTFKRRKVGPELNQEKKREPL